MEHAEAVKVFESWTTTESPDCSWEDLGTHLQATFLDLTKGQIFYVEVRRGPLAPRREVENPNPLRQLIRSVRGGPSPDADPVLNFYRMDFACTAVALARSSPAAWRG